MGREEVISKAILLCGVGFLEAFGRRSSKTALTKALFLAEWEALKNKIRAPSFRFTKNQYGPFDKDIYSYLDSLQESGLVGGDRDRITSRGKSIAEQIERKMIATSDGRFVFEQLAGHAERFAKMEKEAIAAIVYEMQCPHEPTKKIRDAVDGEVLLDPGRFEAKTISMIDDVISDLSYIFSLSEAKLASMQKSRPVDIDDLDGFLEGKGDVPDGPSSPGLG